MTDADGPAVASNGREHRTAAREWIRERVDDAPPRLGAALEGILADLPASAGDEGPWDVMARGAVGVLRSVDADAGDHEAALELLAADALLTYAFQCAAEEGGDLEEAVERWGPRGRLGEAVARAVAEERRRDDGGDGG